MKTWFPVAMEGGVALGTLFPYTLGLPRRILHDERRWCTWEDEPR